MTLFLILVRFHSKAFRILCGNSKKGTMHESLSLEYCYHVIVIAHFQAKKNILYLPEFVVVLDN